MPPNQFHHYTPQLDDNNNPISFDKKEVSKRWLNLERDDYTWVYDDQPHCFRREAIRKKYPMVKSFFGTDPHFRHVVAAEVAMQVLACYLIQDCEWVVILVAAYIFGGVINHSLTLAIHDIGHNTAFGNVKHRANRWFSLFANLPIAVPSAIGFKKYHTDHHRYLGGVTDDGILLDTDTPTPWEGKFFRGKFLKFVWLLINPLFYALRPIFTSPKPITEFEIYNIITCLLFNGSIFYLYGIKALSYLVLGTLLALGCHPTSGHFIAEHYNFIKNTETYSYYGILNKILFNVGYHIEHHDFPFIPGSRYPLVSRLAVEYYYDLPYVNSYFNVIKAYLFDPKLGPFSRIHRIYDMKSAKLLVKSDDLKAAIDSNDQYNKVDRIITGISYVNEDCRRNFAIDEKCKLGDYIPNCVTLPKYFYESWHQKMKASSL